MAAPFLLLHMYIHTIRLSRRGAKTWRDGMFVDSLKIKNAPRPLVCGSHTGRGCSFSRPEQRRKHVTSLHGHPRGHAQHAREKLTKHKTECRYICCLNRMQRFGCPHPPRGLSVFAHTAAAASPPSQAQHVRGHAEHPPSHRRLLHTSQSVLTLFLPRLSSK